MKSKIVRLPTEKTLFSHLRDGDMFGFRENPMVLIVLKREHRKHMSGNSVVLNPAGDGGTAAGCTISVPDDREVVRIMEAIYYVAT